MVVSRSVGACCRSRWANRPAGAARTPPWPSGTWPAAAPRPRLPRPAGPTATGTSPYAARPVRTMSKWASGTASVGRAVGRVHQRAAAAPPRPRRTPLALNRCSCSRVKLLSSSSALAQVGENAFHPHPRQAVQFLTKETASSGKTPKRPSPVSTLTCTGTGSAARPRRLLGRLGQRPRRVQIRHAGPESAAPRYVSACHGTAGFMTNSGASMPASRRSTASARRAHRQPAAPPSKTCGPPPPGRGRRPGP